MMQDEKNQNFQSEHVDDSREESEGSREDKDEEGDEDEDEVDDEVEDEEDARALVMRGKIIRVPDR